MSNLNALVTPWIRFAMSTFAYIDNNKRKLFRFGVIGTLGTFINFMVYYMLTEFALMNSNLSSVSAFCVAILNNYLLNRCWTFAAENQHSSPNIKQFLKYFFANLGGLCSNLLVLNLVVYSAGLRYHLLGQMLGIFLGMISNFFFIRTFVFSAIERIQ